MRTRLFSPAPSFSAATCIFLLFNALALSRAYSTLFCFSSIEPLGFCTFVLSLRPEHIKFQFKQFAWTHIALLLIVTTSQLIIRSIYEGLMWYVLVDETDVCLVSM